MIILLAIERLCKKRQAYEAATILQPSRPKPEERVEVEIEDVEVQSSPFSMSPD